MRTIFWALALCVVVGPMAAAPRDCSKLSGAAQDACEFSAAGLASTEALMAQGRDFLRLELSKNYPTIIVQFQRSPSGPVVMAVGDPQGKYPAFVGILPEPTWQGLVARWKTLPQDLARWRTGEAARRGEEERNGIETVCLHPWYGGVEANLTGTLVTMDGGACDDGFFIDYAWDAARAAVQAAPECAMLDTEGRGLPPNVLRICLMLGGDRIAAARGWNSTLQLGLPRETTKGVKRYEATSMQPLIAADATASISGKPQLRGRQAVAEALVAFLNGLPEPYFGPEHVAGAHDGAVATAGVFIRVRDGRFTHEEQAPVELVWRKQDDGSFKLHAMTVGRFKRVPE